ncbi:MAG: hypothetical protein CBE33_03325 [Candidatus Pelagibacter sp. TMED273]|nr:MAG: hypothetical protein CBE33_03325 [Candidatus Pelagibacter sp. TMED273]
MINQNFPSINVIGNETPPRSGAFEITYNGKIIYSKFETNKFPTEEEIISLLNR